VGVAALGVLWLSVQVGHPPWIALVLAVSFGLYGFVRKTVAVESVAGLAVETALIFPFAAGWLIWEAVQGQAAFLHKGAAMDGLLIASGIVTAVPLVLFAYGVRRVPLSTVGLLQYMAPSLQLVVAIVFFHEPFTQVQLIGFSFIWAALAIYAVDGLLRNRTPRPSLVASAEAS
jgi:chloramphenicol-sensitive protein RarD